MSRLTHHLDQISLCCSGIDSLPFPPPKIFTNALLSNHDITSLIRDTESHERALFSVPPPPPTQTAQPSSSSSTSHKHTSSNAEDQQSAPKRRRTVFNVTSGEVTTGPPTNRSGGANPRRHTAVSAVLGGEMTAKLQRSTGAAEVDVDILLKGAEKLCGVYDQPGARERIAQLRSKHRAGKSTMAYYEAKVGEQAEQLAKYNRDWMDDGDEDGEDEEEEEVWTMEDLRREEEEAREMERKKKELQARLKAMNQDLGGLMDMS